MKRYLLDTGLLLGFSRGAQWASNASETLNLSDPEAMVFTSAICHGEMVALAEKNGWGSKKRTRLDQMLSKIPQLGISPDEIKNAYALIDTWTHGKPVAAPQDAPPPKPAVPMKQNDLWIAATAHVSGATLISTDENFLHLDTIWLTCAYVPPE